VGIYASNASVEASKISIGGSAGPAVIVKEGAKATIEDSTLEGNRDCGIKASGSSTVVLRRDHLSRNRCGVGFEGAATLEAYASRFSDHPLGPLAAKPSVAGAVVLKGSGNTGVEMTQAGFGAAPAAATAPAPAAFANDIFNRGKKRSP
jgi:hypothetical protein